LPRGAMAGIEMTAQGWRDPASSRKKW